jgi:transcriptional regulator with XRE-family HTH domain
MTPAELARARKRLKLSAAELGRALRLGGRDPGQQVRRWETGATDAIPGPVQVAVEYLLHDADRAADLPAPAGLDTAAYIERLNAEATEKPVEAPEPPPAPIVPPTPPKPFTRRRGGR